MAEDKVRLGGMALANGVLVHGPTSWACAVRTDDGELKVVGRAQARAREPRSTNPLLRGPARLLEVFALLPADPARAARGEAAVPAARACSPRCSGARASSRLSRGSPAARPAAQELVGGAALARAGRARAARLRARRLPRRRAHLDRQLRARRAARPRSTSAAARTCSARCWSRLAVGNALAVARARARSRPARARRAAARRGRRRRPRSSAGWCATPSTASPGRSPGPATSSSTGSRPPSRRRSSSRSPRPRSPRASSSNGNGDGRRAAHRERLPPEIFDLPVEKMREGYYTDAYFNHTRAALLATAATRAS